MNKTSINTIATICLYVADVSESVRFYRDVLGLEPDNPNEDAETSTFYAFRTGQTVFAIERNGIKKKGMKTKAENSVLLQFQAESPEHLEALNCQLEKNGIPLLDRSKQTPYGLITNFCDPDGNKVEIIYS